MVRSEAPEELEAWAGFRNQQERELGGRPRTARRMRLVSGWHRFWLTRGTMPAAAALAKRHRGVAAVTAFLRGYGQVFFMDNPATGLLFLIALIIEAPYVALYSAVGCAASTAFATVALTDSSLVANGLHGYNGVLVGAALALFHIGSDDEWDDLPYLAVPVAVIGAFSAVVTVGVSTVMVTSWGVAPLTFPFQLATWLWLLAAQGSQHYPIDGTILQPGVATVAVPGEPEATGVDWELAAKAVLVNVSQVMLVEDAVAGALIVLGIALASPIAAGMAVVGSVVSLLTAFGIGAPEGAIYAGLYGYNGVLGAMAIGGVFFTPSQRGFVMALFCAVLSTVASGATAAALAPVGMPALTFPFTLVVWVFAISGGALRGLERVALASLTVPEEHLERSRAKGRWRKVRKSVVASTMGTAVRSMTRVAADPQAKPRAKSLLLLSPSSTTMQVEEL